MENAGYRQDITLQLDDTGNAALTEDQIDNILAHRNQPASICAECDLGTDGPDHCIRCEKNRAFVYLLKARSPIEKKMPRR